MQLVNLTGRTFGRLTVVARAENLPSGRVQWACRCECGRGAVAVANNLLRGKHISCGCHRDENRTKHGHTRKGSYRSRTYQSWSKMRDRCGNVNSDEYERYGGRGITVCERWSEFANFLADMGERPLGRTIDRIDNNGNYEPGNCRWSTPKEQASNRRLPRKDGTAKTHRRKAG